MEKIHHKHLGQLLPARARQREREREWRRLPNLKRRNVVFEIRRIMSYEASSSALHRPAAAPQQLSARASKNMIFLRLQFLGFLSSMWTWYWISIHHQRHCNLDKLRVSSQFVFPDVRAAATSGAEIFPRSQWRQKKPRSSSSSLFTKHLQCFRSNPYYIARGCHRNWVSVGISYRNLFYQKCNPIKAQTGSEQVEDLYRIHSDENNI